MPTDDRPVVTDFGIVQAGDAIRPPQTGIVMGTPGYLAPELIEGQPSSPASDVHSWGSTMAFAASGHRTFGNGSYETIFHRMLSDQADLTGIPAPLVPLITAALAREPSHRPSASWLSAHVFALDLSSSSEASTEILPDFRDPGSAAATPDLPLREATNETSLSRLAELERVATEWDRENRHEDYLLRGDRLVGTQLPMAKYPGVFYYTAGDSQKNSKRFFERVDTI
jgi:serine/threonine protein kinase